MHSYEFVQQIAVKHAQYDSKWPIRCTKLLKSTNSGWSQ